MKAPRADRTQPPARTPTVPAPARPSPSPALTSGPPARDRWRAAAVGADCEPPSGSPAAAPANDTVTLRRPAPRACSLNQSCKSACAWPSDSTTLTDDSNRSNRPSASFSRSGHCVSAACASTRASCLAFCIQRPVPLAQRVVPDQQAVEPEDADDQTARRSAPRRSRSTRAGARPADHAPCFALGEAGRRLTSISTWSERGSAAGTTRTFANRPDFCSFVTRSAAG